MNTLLDSIMIDTDAYKVSMWKQYPPGTEYVSSYIEARKNPWVTTTWYGLAHILETLAIPITPEQVEFANRYWLARDLPFNYYGWMKLALDPILKGNLPLRIQAAPEGTVMEHGNVLVQVINTDPRFFWLTTWVETKLMRVWYPTTVASLSAAIKKDIYAKLVMTADAPDEEILFKLHDFGSRGASSRESAGIGGSGQLLNFMGSDTGVAGLHAMQFYNAPIDGVDASIPAAEHSTITSWGRDNEVQAFENMIEQFGSGPVAVVSDSYDIYNAVTNIWGKELKDRIIKMDGMLVVRPDSGDPTLVPVEVVQLLDKAFGHTINTKGYKVLNHVRVIQGDGIDQVTINIIMDRLIALGYSITNIAFGMGGALLQRIDRDTMAFAMKASTARINGKWIDVFKDPVTDSGKRSKKGRLALVNLNDKIQTIREDELVGNLRYPGVNLLHTVFEDGDILLREQWPDVVSRARI
jgi:nicotinamide phosphoribosyltransferase